MADLFGVSDWTEQELIELYNERAAIREHDGGMSREQAEEAAYYDLRRIVGQGVSVPVEITSKVKKFKRNSDGTK